MENKYAIGTLLMNIIIICFGIGFWFSDSFYQNPGVISGWATTILSIAFLVNLIVFPIWMIIKEKK